MPIVSCNSCSKPLLPSALLKHLESCIGLAQEVSKKKIEIIVKKRKLPSDQAKVPKPDKEVVKKPKVAAAINLDIQCGALLENGTQCMRTISCKVHSVNVKRAVLGRSNTYDILYQEHGNKAAKKAAAVQAQAALSSSTSVPLISVNTYTPEEDVLKIMNIIQNNEPAPQATYQPFSMKLWLKEKNLASIMEVFQR
ncbi:hypothetical protein HK103_007347 [Boothiomyces macroporosus]|uniref:SCA7 domain-containing protein n=1 Tax=Boothiomyces macroporosus TaxID=261099 RepID=A0AAD5UKW4_9FUNG|nr:hypothetical protein HK103_007347 [Boothiomyces macroporosus]